jgi:hypothetical protein
MTPDDEMEHLRVLYAEVYADGFWISEYDGIAAVGDLRDLEMLARDSGRDVDQAVEQLGLGEAVDLTAPGGGDTREARVRDAWQLARRYGDDGTFPRLVAARAQLGMTTNDPKPLGTF